MAVFLVLLLLLLLLLLPYPARHITAGTKVIVAVLQCTMVMVMVAVIYDQGGLIYTKVRVVVWYICIYIYVIKAVVVYTMTQHITE